MFIAYLNDEKYRDVWNKYVLSEGGQFWQSWEWGQIQKEKGKEVFFIAIFKKDDSGRDIFCASCISCLEKLSFGKSALTVRRGPAMDFLSADMYPAIEMLFAELEKIAKEKKAVFLRIDPPILNSATSYLGAYFSIFDKNKIIGSEKRLTDRSQIRIDLSQTEDEIASKFSTKFAYNLKIAKSRFEAGISGKFKDADVYLPLLKEKTSIKEELISVCRNLNQFAAEKAANSSKKIDFSAFPVKIFFAKEKGELSALIITINFGSCCTVIYEKNNLKNDQSPLYLLNWEAVKSAKSGGLNIYETSREKSAVADDIGGKLEFLSDSYDIVYNKFWHRILKNFKI